MKNKLVFLSLPFVLVSLIFGLWSGFIRLGFNLPITKVAALHGGLMVGSFLGTLIILERVVALKQKWMYAGPAICGLSIVLFFSGMHTLAYYCLAIGSAFLIVIYFILIERFKEYYFYIMLIGAVGWLTGNVMMLVKNMYPLAAPWWIMFILLTVVGERIELSKFLPKKKFKNESLVIFIIIYLVGLMMPFHSVGQFVAGTGLILIALWLWKFDMVRISIKSKGIHKHTGILLLCGYVWLFITGIIFMWPGHNPMMYDALLHSFFIGFTFSMIFAHGPIILPGVLGIPVKPFHPVLYVWGVALQLSLVGRILGDMLGQFYWKKSFGMANGIIILGFFVTLVVLTIIEARKSRS